MKTVVLVGIVAALVVLDGVLLRCWLRRRRAHQPTQGVGAPDCDACRVRAMTEFSPERGQFLCTECLLEASPS